jgi:hypothetical protein
MRPWGENDEAFRWLPGFTLARRFRGKSFLDAELSVNAWGSADIYSLEDIRMDGRVLKLRPIFTPDFQISAAETADMDRAVASIST